MTNEVICLLQNDDVKMDMIFSGSSNINCCEDTSIAFDYLNNKYVLYNDVIIDALDSLKNLSEKILKNELIIHDSINLDIGFLQNEYDDFLWKKNLSKKRKYDFFEIHGNWIGSNYMLFDGRDIFTWLYQKNNLIYLEVTPYYKWHSRDPDKGEEFIPYEEWIKNYNPIAIVEIDKKTIQRWNEFSTKMINSMYE